MRLRAAVRRETTRARWANALRSALGETLRGLVPEALIAPLAPTRRLHMPPHGRRARLAAHQNRAVRLTADLSIGRDINNHGGSPVPRARIWPGDAPWAGGGGRTAGCLAGGGAGGLRHRRPR